jgi:hypothetical protein
MIPAYGKVYVIGHKEVADLFIGEVIIQEKIDGSQFSFSVDTDGRLWCRSKGVNIEPEAPPAMFAAAVDTVKSLVDKLVPGWVYRAECLMKPKHNTLCYSRVPIGNIILFDIDHGIECYLPHSVMRAEVDKLGLECVPLLGGGLIRSVDQLIDILQTESILGGTTIEGFVVKNYNRFTMGGHILKGKYVSERFKEDNKKTHKIIQTADVLASIIDTYCTEQRWRKSLEHLRDDNELEFEPRDISKLVGTVCKDVHDECADEIKEALFKWAWKRVAKGLTRGLAEWYKQYLLERQFEKEKQNGG